MAGSSDDHTPKQTLSGLKEKTLTGHEVARRAVGYIRVSTDMQAADGLSLEAQQAAIERFCEVQGLRLIRLCRDVASGAKEQRPGLQEALDCLQRGVDVLVVLKFDRLSRSIRHFCELYERYFQSGEKELIAIRESIRLDSALGRALISILLVFAQMEREVTGERTRESIRHIRSRGYFFGKVPYGKRAVPAPDNPRYRILVDEPAEQAVLTRLNTWAAEGLGTTEMAARLNAEGVPPPQDERWNKNTIYNLKLRLSLIKPGTPGTGPQSPAAGSASAQAGGRSRSSGTWAEGCEPITDGAGLRVRCGRVCGGRLSWPRWSAGSGGRVPQESDSSAEPGRSPSCGG